MGQKANFQINFATKNISSRQIGDKKQIWKISSALRQKGDFVFLNQIYDKKTIVKSILQEEETKKKKKKKGDFFGLICDKKANFQISSWTKGTYF